MRETVHKAKRKRVRRETVDLSEFPDLVVIYLGMRVNRPKGLWTLLKFGRRIERSVEDEPDGLLVHERIAWGLLPPHLGMRQYWRDFESLERWARTGVHKEWWKEFLDDAGGCGFWHETYFMEGGMEAIFDDIPKPMGFQHFAKNEVAKGTLFSARRRLQREGKAPAPPPVKEEEFYRRN